MPTEVIPTEKIPNRNRRGLLGLTEAEKDEVVERTKAERKAKIKAMESVPPRPVELRPMTAWPQSGHYTKHRG